MYRKLAIIATVLMGASLPAMAQIYDSTTSNSASGTQSTIVTQPVSQDTSFNGVSYSPSSSNTNQAYGGTSQGNTTSIGGYSNTNTSSSSSTGGSTDFHNNDFSSSATGGAGGSATGGSASSGSASYSGGSTSSTGASTSSAAGGRSASTSSGGSTGAVTNDNRSNSKNKSSTSPFTVFAPTPVQPRNTAGVQFIDPHGAMPQEVEAHDFSMLGGYAFSNSYVGPTRQSQDSYRISRIASVCSIEAGKGRSASVAALALIDPDMGKILAREGCN